MIRNLLFDNQGNVVLSLLVGRIGLALLYVVIAAICAWLIPPLVQRSVLAWAEMRVGVDMSERRKNTIARLMLTLTRAAIVAIAAVAVLSLFVNSAGLFTFLGLFTAAMGFALRQYIGDYISGFIFLFEDQFAMGDDVQIGGERGIVGDVSMRTTTLRAPTGETRIVPNSEIRIVYNYARAPFRQVSVQIPVYAADLERALGVLDELAQRLPAQVPQLEGTPQVLVDGDALGTGVTLTLTARAQTGAENETKRRIVAAILQALSDNDIQLAGDGAG